MAPGVADRFDDLQSTSAGPGGGGVTEGRCRSGGVVPHFDTDFILGTQAGKANRSVAVYQRIRDHLADDQADIVSLRPAHSITDEPASLRYGFRRGLEC